MSDTPRTDSVTEHHYTAGGLRSASVVQAWFARELERELAALRVEVALVRVENERVRSDIDRIRAEVEQRTAEVAKANAERDEARRKWCELASAFSASIITAEGLAKERGWDCFDAKEGEP